MKTRCRILCVLCLTLSICVLYHFFLFRETTAKLDATNIVIEQRDSTIYALETRCRLQVRDIKMWGAKRLALVEQVIKLHEVIRGYKALNEAQEGRIHKMAGAYRIRELNLLQQIEELKKKLQDCDTPPNQEPIEPAPPIPKCR